MEKFQPLSGALRSLDGGKIPPSHWGLIDDKKILASHFLAVFTLLYNLSLWITALV
jgi:hypothetical protein